MDLCGIISGNDQILSDGKGKKNVLYLSYEPPNYVLMTLHVLKASIVMLQL